MGRQTLHVLGHSFFDSSFSQFDLRISQITALLSVHSLPHRPHVLGHSALISVRSGPFDVLHKPLLLILLQLTRTEN